VALAQLVLALDAIGRLDREQTTDGAATANVVAVDLEAP